MNSEVDLFRKTIKFDTDTQGPQDLKLLNIKMIGYKQCKNTFPSPHTEHNLSRAIIKSLHCMHISLLEELVSKVYLYKLTITINKKLIYI